MPWAGLRKADPSRSRSWPSPATAEQDPVPRYQDFTSDVDRLTRFVASLQPVPTPASADPLH